MRVFETSMLFLSVEGTATEERSGCYVMRVVFRNGPNIEVSLGSWKEKACMYASMLSGDTTNLGFDLTYT